MTLEPSSGDAPKRPNPTAVPPSPAVDNPNDGFDVSYFYDPAYERSGEKLLPFPRFLSRLGMSFLFTGSLVVVALSIGILGYHYFGGLAWIDALLNASMILTGMGPVDTLHTRGAKLFASGYALFSGVVFLSSLGIVLAPVFHRVVHKFHLEDSGDPPAGGGSGTS